MPTTEADAPEFVVVGHVTRDLLPDGGWVLGGTVTFAALTAQRLGLRAGIVTSAPTDLLAALAAALPGVALANRPAQQATTFANRYEHGARRQWIFGVAPHLSRDAVPRAWLGAGLVLLSPVAQEVDPALAAAFPTAIVAATPQGWLRAWDADGLVRPAPLTATAALAYLRALIVSREDVAPAATAPMPAGALPFGALPLGAHPADGAIAAWAARVPLVVVTAGAQGARLVSAGADAGEFAAYPAHEVDPTGAGDVFAAAFLIALGEGCDAGAAVDFANRVAACSVERHGGDGIPTRAQLAQRFPTPLDRA